jgi:hypothetical protein
VQCRSKPVSSVRPSSEYRDGWTIQARGSTSQFRTDAYDDELYSDNEFGPSPCNSYTDSHSVQSMDHSTLTSLGTPQGTSANSANTGSRPVPIGIEDFASKSDYETYSPSSSYNDSAAHRHYVEVVISPGSSIHSSGSVPLHMCPQPVAIEHFEDADEVRTSLWRDSLRDSVSNIADFTMDLENVNSTVTKS